MLAAIALMGRAALQLGMAAMPAGGADPALASAQLEQRRPQASSVPSRSRNATSLSPFTRRRNPASALIRCILDASNPRKP
jgi:hypothetical protein